MGVHGKFAKSKHKIFIFSFFLEWGELPTNYSYGPKAQLITDLESQQNTGTHCFNILIANENIFC
jgi:hypothetical protein